MLMSIYQPIVGAYAVSFYQLLYQQIAPDKVGYSALEQQRWLFMQLDLEPSEKGRKFLIEQASKLEALGLLQTSRKYVPEFGIATECGFARARKPDLVRKLIDIHAGAAKEPG